MCFQIPPALLQFLIYCGACLLHAIDGPASGLEFLADLAEGSLQPGNLESSASLERVIRLIEFGSNSPKPLLSFDACIGSTSLACGGERLLRVLDRREDVSRGR